MTTRKTQPAILCDNCGAISVFNDEAAAEECGEENPYCEECGGDNRYIDANPARIEAGYYN